MAEQFAGQGYGLSLDDVEEWLNGGAVRYYRVSALMTVRPFPALTAEQRDRFSGAIGELFSRLIMPPTVKWDDRGQAHVNIACGGENATLASDRAKEIIERNAAYVAHIYVSEISVLETEPLETVA